MVKDKKRIKQWENGNLNFLHLEKASSCEQKVKENHVKLFYYRISQLFGEENLRIFHLNVKKITLLEAKFYRRAFFQNNTKEVSLYNSWYLRGPRKVA